MEQNESVEIDILSIKDECFICFEESENVGDGRGTHKKYNVLKCCNSAYLIHKSCLFKIFLVFLKTPFEKDVMCPLCRTNINITDYFNLEESLEIFEKYDESTRKEYIQKMTMIISHHYLDFTRTLTIDSQTSQVHVKPSWLKYLKKYITTILIILLIIIFVIIYYCNYKDK